ncbi:MULTISPECIES: hypothetical protein [unclassified Halorhodospira]|uniref:hypothetical protein n=1 Tax=unclassified Halorhodospira TaxID=2626748 RepID=UPI001EE8081A|nr:MULTISPECIES: hypothetical protein [unclassified Halorhodospira]MCG5540143.1 hypothetical protein [Halorhodospira sp. M39old]MCG5545156.1 hypothetical protein [Halorhodospira sp. M38]
MAYLAIQPGGSRCGADRHRQSVDQDSGRRGALEAGWSWCEGRLQVWGDRLGMIPVFYGFQEGGVIVADNLAELCRHRATPNRPNDSGIAVFLRLGYFCANQTVVEGVYVLGPGERWSWSPGQPPAADGAVRYPRFCVVRDAGDRLERLAQAAFAEAITARAPDRVATLPLSGGRDSRHILLELHRQRVPVERVVCGHRLFKNELGVAAGLAARLGLALEEAGCLDEHELDGALEAEKNRRTHFASDEHTWYLAVAARLRGAYLDGLGGDMLLNGLQFSASLAEALRRGDVDAAAHRLLAAGADWGQVLQGPWAERWSAAQARAAIREELARHVDAVCPARSFRFWNRTRREIALIPVALRPVGSRVGLPFLDPAILELGLGRPEGRAEDEVGLHDRVIARAYPAHRGVPYGAYGVTARDLNRRSRRRLYGARLAEGAMLARGAPQLSRGGYLRALWGRWTVQPRYLWWQPAMQCIVQAFRELELAGPEIGARRVPSAGSGGGCPALGDGRAG